MTVDRFAGLPAIAPLAGIPRWTFSAIVDDRKRPGKKKKIPVDLPHLLSKDPYENWRGARAENRPYIPLTEIAAEPDLNRLLNNTCFRLSQTQGDGFVVLDVEPDCPDEDKKAFFALPWFYAEVSMSGRGIHLLLPAPASFPEIRLGKPSLKPKDRNDYEILLNQHVTFSMRPLARDASAPVRPMSDFEALWDKLAGAAKLRAMKEIDASELPDIEDIYDGSHMLAVLADARWKKTPKDYGGDMSRYEYASCLYVYGRMKRILAEAPSAGHQYTDQEKLAMLYAVMKDMLKWRPKHDETRNGLPFLLYQCKQAMGAAEGGGKEKEP